MGGVVILSRRGVEGESFEAWLLRRGVDCTFFHLFAPFCTFCAGIPGRALGRLKRLRREGAAKDRRGRPWSPRRAFKIRGLIFHWLDPIQVSIYGGKVTNFW